MEDYSVPVSSAVLVDCSLDRWNALSPAMREAAAVSLRHALTESGYGFEHWRIEDHGPDREQPVLILTDTRTALDFALIPGGRLLPGYGDAQFERFSEIYELLEGWQRDIIDDEDDEPDDAVELEEDSPYVIPIFASEVPCDLSRKPPVDIAPFLMAVTPTPASTPGIQQVVTSPRWWGETWEEMALYHLPVRLHWEMVPAVLHRYRWSLPTTGEFEWAIRGGKEGIFYWGDTVPHFVANPLPYYDCGDEKDGHDNAGGYDEPAWTPEQARLITEDVRFEDLMVLGFSPESARIWPYCNGFGLAGPLATGSWCAPSTESSDPFPLIVRGGASGSWPWQACGEWMLFLSAVERRLNENTLSGDWNVLRPIIRLQPGDERNA
jgi:hypothetical protein